MMNKKYLLKITLFFFSYPLILILNSCKNNDNNGSTSIDTPAATSGPPILNYSIVQSYPHDTSFYTQGITFYNGELYEGTGDPGYRGKTKLMQVDIKTGKPVKSISLSDKYFGEGITVLRDTVYQLTWQEHVVFVYTLKDFKKVKEFHIDTEGWGLTNDGEKLIVTDGSGDLYFYDPSTFRMLSKISVVEGNSQAYNLNELEYINGYIYANQYTLPYILKIDPKDGKVVAKYNVDDMWKRVKAIDPEADVPNGIAYDSVSKKIFVTGKYWPEIYEVKLD